MSSAVPAGGRGGGERRADGGLAIHRHGLLAQLHGPHAGSARDDSLVKHLGIDSGVFC